MYIKYTHAAYPPFPVDLNKWYTIEQATKEFGLDEEQLKQYFSGVNGEWPEPRSQPRKRKEKTIGESE